MDIKVLERFVIPDYDSNKSKRTEQTYKDVHAFYHKMITDLVTQYKSVTNSKQELREIRNVIDFCLRRVHAYCYRERDGAHYREEGLTEKDSVIFEHLIPAKILRDLLLKDQLTIDEAFNAPTVLLSKEHDDMLRSTGRVKKTPSLVYPFQRYTQSFDTKVVTRCGKEIDMNAWSLEDHYNFFT